ncbi:MAG: hypothetical protein LR001_04820 [Clostridiales bacterium]|nr:hypothetical protein [Clostridiales bacterium]
MSERNNAVKKKRIVITGKDVVRGVGLFVLGFAVADIILLLFTGSGLYDDNYALRITQFSSLVLIFLGTKDKRK